MKNTLFARALLAMALLAGATQHAAQAAPYQAQQTVRGDVRIWGSPDDRALIELWDAGFRKHHPQARVAPSLHGSESAMAGIYTDVADLAFVARELRLPTDNMAFEWVKLHSPSTVEVANAGLGAKRVAANLAVFVHPSNPIAGLSLAQLDAIFGAEHKRGPAHFQTWGDLGLGGEWRERPIHVLALPLDSIPALYFRKHVLMDSFKWAPALEEVASETQALEAVARDPAAIAYAPIAAASPAVKALPLSAAAGGPFVALTEKTARDRSYPLARTVIVAFDHAPGKAVAPQTREFLRFVLSDEGQAAVARDGAYLPLQARNLQQQLKSLD